MECIACGRRLTNDVNQPNAAHWTYAWDERTTRYPYCADSPEWCMREAEREAGPC